MFLLTYKHVKRDLTFLYNFITVKSTLYNRISNFMKCKAFFFINNGYMLGGEFTFFSLKMIIIFIKKTFAKKLENA